MRDDAVLRHALPLGRGLGRVTRVIPPCNYVIQRNRRSKPQVVHGDKLKTYHSPNPANWKTSEVNRPSPIRQGVQQKEEANPEVRQSDSNSGIFVDAANTADLPSKRIRRPTVRFEDHVLDLRHIVKQH